MKAQGQNADCGTDLSSIEEGELMDCEFRDDALGHKKDKMKKLWKKKQVNDMLFLQDMNATVDFSYLAVGLRGSGCTREEDNEGFVYPPSVRCFHSIESEDAFASLTTGRSLDVMEFFAGKAGVTKVCIRRRMRTGPVVDLVYGFDLSSKKERDAWIKYVKQNRPKVVIMGPPCTHFGSFANLNCRYPGFA